MFMGPDDPDVELIGDRHFSIERVSYATVVLMSVLVVYDGWQDLATFVGVAAVIIAPILALGLAHFFSGGLQAYAELQRPPTAAEWRSHGLDQVEIVLAAVPSLVVLGVGWLSPLDTRSTISLILWTGVATLIGLAALAGRRAGLRGWRWALAAVSGGLVGLIVISLQIVLKPN